MRELELDLPLANTAASRFMLWIMAGLTLLAICAFAVAAVSDAALRELNRRPLLVTVAIAAPPERAAEAEKAVLDHLRNRPGTMFVEPVKEREVTDLLGPWQAAERGNMAGVSPPRLLDLALRPEAVSDLARFEAELRAIEPELTLGAVTAPVTGAQLGRLVRAVALGIGICTLLLAGLAAVVITRMSLDLHAETVDLLRLMGASDRYVARQFELHALARGMRGAAIGFACGVLSFFALLELAPLVGGEIVQDVALRPLDWIILAAVSVFLVLLVTLATRLAAIWGLARLR